MKKKKDKLSGAVLTYRRTGDRLALHKVLKESQGLIRKQMRYYYMQYFPTVIQDEVFEACQSKLLLKAIKTFRPSKGGRFSTWFTWKLKSFIRCRKHYFLRRKKIIEAESLNTLVFNKNNESLSYIDIQPASASMQDMVARKHRYMRQIFGI